MANEYERRQAQVDEFGEKMDDSIPALAGLADALDIADEKTATAWLKKIAAGIVAILAIAMLIASFLGAFAETPQPAPTVYITPVETITETGGV